MSKKTKRLVLLVVAVAVAAAVGFQVWRARQSALPPGIVSGNGRIEAKLVDISAKEPLRVKEILADEGQLVQPGEVLVRMDTATLESQLAEAKATVATTEQKAAVNKSAIVRRKSEVDLAQVESERARKLFEQNAGSKQDFDRRTASLQVTKAALEEEEAGLKTVMQQVEVAQANVATIQTRIDDATLKSPVRGRVLYRLAEVGEVLAAGGKALTLVNLEDVYMEIFLPAEDAASLKIGDEARITLDHAPGRAAIGHVSFVSPEAQFTPKQVETRSERDKLMFRVKIQVPEELIKTYIERIKTGVRGVGYVKTNASAVWPEWLQNLVESHKELNGKQVDKPADSKSETETRSDRS
ncbi:MAG TPA: HlyD family efflux transporter periplasmic adaptor subunit [Pirellulales bacterium]|jgi:HlyD family secretion protein